MKNEGVRMNKKRITLVLTAIVMLLVLTGCSTSNDLITDATTFNDAMNADGLFGGILIWPLAKSINFIADKTGSVFASICIVTLVINAVLLALTFKSNMAMQRMNQIQPELTKIQKKYEGRSDQQSQMKMSQEMQALYKKYDVNPMGALGVTFLQFPLLIAMYSAVRKSSAVATGKFLGATLALTPREALANKSIPLLAIYVLMIVFQFISVMIPQWLNKARAKKEAEIHHRHYEEPKQANAGMTYGMVVFIAFIMISWPTALSLYYMVYSVINIVKTIALQKISDNSNK